MVGYTILPLRRNPSGCNSRPKLKTLLRPLGLLDPTPALQPRPFTHIFTHSLTLGPVSCLSLSLPVSLSLYATTIWLLQRTNKPSLVQPSLFSLLSLTLPPPLSRSRSLSSSHVLPPRLSYCLSFVPAQDNHSSTASWAGLFRFYTLSHRHPFDAWIPRLPPTTATSRGC
ncbi:hypothetical protein LZ32DRAFT_333514 [Colletotrichum eremochloae]|nr:hypothetical protein LZ32DRAFT_333514 [Colletotrichum eremochloae]